MRRIDTDLPGVFLIEPVVHGDRRGWFTETWRRDIFATLGIAHDFVQDNQSLSGHGVLRGLHYQLGRPQAKLVRVLHGEVYDVALDVRRGSPSFGRWTAVVLTGENRRMLYIPAGFAHGFYVVSETAEFFYKCSDLYAPAEERGIAWNDPGLAIPWPLAGQAPVLSEKDLRYGTLATRLPADLPAHTG